MNPKLAKQIENAVTVTLACVAGGAMSVWITGSLFHAAIVVGFCAGMLIWIIQR